jgi:type II secretory pathway pseudopilin PulG
MKRLVLAVAILGALAFVGGPLLTGSKVQAATKERAVVEFTQTVKLLNVFLRGQYVVLHDDSKMAQGEPCLSVYRKEDPDNLIIAFHCKQVARDKTDQFTIRTSRRAWFDLPEVLEIQFAGATSAHQVR